MILLPTPWPITSPILGSCALPLKEDVAYSFRFARLLANPSTIFGGVNSRTSLYQRCSSNVYQGRDATPAISLRFIVQRC